MWLEINEEQKVIFIHDEQPETENELIEVEGSWTNGYIIEKDIYVVSTDPISFRIESTVFEQQLTELQLLAQSVSEREIQEIIQGQQISELEIRLLMGGM